MVSLVFYGREVGYSMWIHDVGLYKLAKKSSPIACFPILYILKDSDRRKAFCPFLWLCSWPEQTKKWGDQLTCLYACFGLLFKG